MNIKKNLIFNIILSVSNIIFPVITFPYISRVLGPEGTGLNNFAMAFCEYFIIIAGLGVPLYGIREIAKARETIAERSKIFFEIFLIRLFTTILVLIPYFIIIINVKKFGEDLSLYYWGAVLIMANTGSIEWFFTGLENFKYITSRSLVVKVFSVLIMFIVVKHKSDVLNYFLITVFIVVVNGIIDVRYALRFVTFKVDWASLNFRKHLKPLFYIFSSLLAIKVYTLIDTIILGFLSTDKAVGYYSAVMKLIRISLTIITSLSTVLIPRLANAAGKNNFGEVAGLLKNSFSFVYTLGIPMMVIIYSLAPELVGLFSGHEFEPAIITLQILSPLILIVGMASVFSTQILTAFAKDRLVMTASVIGAIISVGLNFLLVPILKQDGSAVSNVLTELIVTIVCFYFARKFIEINLLYRDILLNLASTVPSLLLPILLRVYIHNLFFIVVLTLSSALISFFLFNIYIIKTTLVLDLISKFRNNWKVYLRSKSDF